MPAVPQIPKIITFSIDGEDFSLDVLDAGVVPTPGAIQTVKTLDGVTHQDAESVSWALVLRMILDWDTTRPGLAYYLFQNDGTQQTFILNVYDAAISTAAPAVTGTATMVAVAYGGTGNTFVEATVTLPMTGAPVPDTTP